MQRVRSGIVQAAEAESVLNAAFSALNLPVPSASSKDKDKDKSKSSDEKRPKSASGSKPSTRQTSRQGARDKKGAAGAGGAGGGEEEKREPAKPAIDLMSADAAGEIALCAARFGMLPLAKECYRRVIPTRGETREAVVDAACACVCVCVRL